MIHLANFWLYNTIIVLSWRFLANHIMPITIVLLYYPEACSQYLAGPEPVKGLFTKPDHDNPDGSFLHFTLPTMTHSRHFSSDLRFLYQKN